MNALRQGLYTTCLFFALLLGNACSNQDVTSFEPAVSDSVMIQLLIDMHLAEAHAEILNLPSDGLQDSILMHYQLSRADFEANMAYYEANPDAFHKVYSEVLDKISEERFQPGN
ncbi:MAG: DUF4296 domain-containing protein [Bacteroidota bacterium]